MEGRENINNKLTKDNKYRDNNETQLPGVLEYLKDQQQYDYNNQEQLIIDNPFSIQTLTNNNKHVNIEKKLYKQKFSLIKKFSSPNIEKNNITLLSRKKSKSRLGLFNKGKSSILGSNDTVRKGVADLVFSEASFLNDHKLIPSHKLPLILTTQSRSSLIQGEATRFFNSIQKKPDQYSLNSFQNNSSQLSSQKVKHISNNIQLHNDQYRQQHQHHEHHEQQNQQEQNQEQQQQVPYYARGITPQKYSPKTYIHSSFNDDIKTRSMEPWESVSINDYHRHCQHHGTAIVLSPTSHYRPVVDKQSFMKYPTKIEPDLSAANSFIVNSVHPQHQYQYQQSSVLNQQQQQQQHHILTIMSNNNNNNNNTIHDVYNKNKNNNQKYRYNPHQGQQKIPLFTLTSSFATAPAVTSPPALNKWENVTPFISQKPHYLSQLPPIIPSSSIHVPHHLSSYSYSTIFPINEIVANVNKKFDQNTNNTMKDGTMFPQFLQSLSNASNYLDI
ncbi:unnamed protein product [Cunninghamella echinulata]